MRFKLMLKNGVVMRVDTKGLSWLIENYPGLIRKAPSSIKEGSFEFPYEGEEDD
jgi:hypothetical protein